MSYLGRIASRVGASDAMPAAPQTGARPIPAMSIRSPLVEADQRLDMPQFAELAMDAAPVGREIAPDVSPAAPSAVRPPAKQTFERAEPGWAEAPVARVSAAEARRAVLPAERLASPVVHALMPDASAIDARGRGSITSNRADTISTIAAPVVPPPRAAQSASPVPNRAAEVHSTPVLDSSGGTLGSPRMSDAWLNAFAEVGAWLSSGSGPRSAGEERDGGDAAGPSRAGETRSIVPMPRKEGTTGGPIDTAPGAPRAERAESSPARAVPRVEPMARGLDSMRAPIEPMPLAPHRAAIPDPEPAFAAPAISIGHIEVEVVPPVPVAPLPVSSAPDTRASRRGRTSRAFEAPLRPFGWRQR